MGFMRNYSQWLLMGGSAGENWERWWQRQEGDLGFPFNQATLNLKIIRQKHEFFFNKLLTRKGLYHMKKSCKCDY